jgi:hypothetical protein
MTMRPATDPVLLLTGSTGEARPLHVRPRHLVAALSVATLIVSVTLFALLPGGGARPQPPSLASYTAPGGAFSLRYPAGWQATAAGPRAAAIERADRSAVVTVRESGSPSGSLPTLARTLPAELAARFDDFRPLGARAVRLSTGPALVYTFARTRSDTVETMVIAPAGSHSFTLVVVARGGASQAAREAGAIVRSLQAR